MFHHDYSIELVFNSCFSLCLIEMTKCYSCTHGLLKAALGKMNLRFCTECF